MQENYKILGLEEGATAEQVREAYERLRARYAEDRFLDGERGNEAAKNLTLVESAYREIMADMASRTHAENEKFDYSSVEKCLKQNNISEAQRLLDEISDRDAEWHYLQSVVFYRKQWMNDAKKQLEIAMNMEPANPKYKESYTKLKDKIAFTEKQFQSGNAAPQSHGNEEMMGGNACSSFMNFCTTMCCMNMLYNCCCGR